MPTAIVADDEPLMREALVESLRKLWPELEIVAEAEDGLAALMAIETHRPDFAFLDIRMPGMTGLEVARAQTSTKTQVVFATAYDNHAIEAFEANAVDYLLKPLEPARLLKTLTKLKRSLAQEGPGGMSAARLAEALALLGVQQPATPPILQAPLHDPRRLEWLQVAVGAQGQQIRMLHMQDVMYFESDTKYTRVVAADCDGLIRMSLKELLQQADQTTFLQTHRSTVVNRRFIQAVHRRGELVEIELKGRPERLRVSEANHPLFRAM